MTLKARVIGFYSPVTSIKVTLRGPMPEDGTEEKWDHLPAFTRVDGKTVSGTVLYDPNYLDHDWMFVPSGANAELLKTKLRRGQEENAA